MPDRKLIAISPAELVHHWPSIRAEVAGIEAPDGFIPEDVYCACKSGEAALFLLSVADERIGWVVLKVIGSDLHIWLLKANNGHDVLAVFRDDLMALARGAGAKMLTFGTKRRGWDKVAPAHGFNVRQIVFECPVPAS